jgi:hypothetical protein
VDSFLDVQNNNNKIEKKIFDTILSNNDFNDFDEGRVEKKICENVKNDTQIVAKIQANSVYQSKNMNLSRFISSHKSKVDFKNYYNQVEFRNLTEFML